MGKYTTAAGFLFGAFLVLSIVALIVSWFAHILWDGMTGMRTPFWVFFLGAFIVLIIGCFISINKRK